MLIDINVIIIYQRSNKLKNVIMMCVKNIFINNIGLIIIISNNRTTLRKKKKKVVVEKKKIRRERNDEEE